MSAMSSARCGICPHDCLIPPGGKGFCGVRENRGGRIVYSSYGKVSAIALDPIEKKPLYMYRPGTRILSVGGFGCNLRCPFCQNSDISMEYDLSAAKTVTPEQISALAEKTVAEGNIGVAYTYNEPLIGYEFVYDCARLVHGAGLSNVLVTNGYINREPLESLLPYIDAMNIDLKAFSESFYSKLGGGLETVRNTIALSQEHCHAEVTTLVIPGENEGDIEELARWLASVSPDIPLHLSRFFPRYKYGDRTPTPRDTIYQLAETAKRYLNNVFCGNM